jgi:hypothetical protein
MKAGTYVVGVVKGFSSQPWTKDPTKFNHRLGLVVGGYQDEWGVDHESIQTVDIQAADVERVKKFAADHLGRAVIVPAVYRARPGGRDGAWISCFMPKEAEITLATGK